MAALKIITVLQQNQRILGGFICLFKDLHTLNKLYAVSKCSTIFTERTRGGHHQSVKGNVGETSERRGGLFQVHSYVFELN